MRDPYQVLGVDRKAESAEIKSAYRKLAKKLHPDVNPDRKDIEQKFKEVTAAYELLSDATKRASYDRGEIDASGNPRSPFGGAGGGGQSYSSYRSGTGRSGNTGGGFAGFNPEDILSGLFGMRGGGARFAADESYDTPPSRGHTVNYTLSVPFIEACTGGKRRITISSGKTIEIDIPVGTQDDHKLRLRGQGQAGAGGQGDAIITIKVEPHPYFTRKDNDIYIDVPVSLPEAITGASIHVPTLHGTVSLKIPAGANSGLTMRVKGQGVPHTQDTSHKEKKQGDMFVKLIITLPIPVPQSLREAIEEWGSQNAYNPRKW